MTPNDYVTQYGTGVRNSPEKVNHGQSSFKTGSVNIYQAEPQVVVKVSPKGDNKSRKYPLPGNSTARKHDSNDLNPVLFYTDNSKEMFKIPASTTTSSLRKIQTHN